MTRRESVLLWVELVAEVAMGLCPFLMAIVAVEGPKGWPILWGLLFAGTGACLLRWWINRKIRFLLLLASGFYVATWLGVLIVRFL